ncbi:LOW QUALITY PROTEIN: uveal autoantigen with coiled-coil domains and ankyrin repeats protein-like [Melanaphis sacchari]|uniref:LOW QUALITY PROTEIN: uveal autoantigen with coiled-coil domains and ankyrin repeats protein-like n=1 Tax=Melanaphis sacchari TaxID=742174 RepID=UPI000DC145BC|nr:LOW QUALITY PROTEIN: uveal autoantigen with coiled-coil domains and ankyrin repeats protein-like [Melanaphis sacchari]
MDFEKEENEYIPIWEESPEVYYDPVILEQELDKIKKEFDELKYNCSEINKENEVLKTEIKTKEKEKIDLNNLHKGNIVKLSLYQKKIMTLNETIKKLNFDKKNLLMVVKLLKEKRVEMDKKYKDTTDSYTTLMITNKELEKINEQFKLEQKQDLKIKDRIKAENDKIKAKIDELQIQNKGFKTQINHQADELRSKEITITGMTRENKILASNIETALIKLSDFEKSVKFLEKKIKTMNKECLESRTKYKGLLYENNALKSKLNDSEELIITMEEMKTNERSMKKQVNKFKRMLAEEQMENKKLIEITHQLEKQKTKYIYTGEDLTLVKRKLAECMDKNLDLTIRFSNLDCPFYQSKYGKIEDKEPKIKCGSLKERHYENKIFALEQVIKTLHLKIKSQDEKQLKYREVVIKNIYNTKAIEKKLKLSNELLEKQKYQIIYDEIDTLSKESKIQNLKIQNDNYDHQCKLLNRQSTLLCKKIKDYNLKIESMKKESTRANKILKDAEQKNDELLYKTEQLKKCTENIETQLLNNDKCKKLQQSEVDKMRYSIEEFQKKFHKIQEELNITNQKNHELTNSITHFQTQSEFNHKVQSKNINDAKCQIKQLLIQNKLLTFENKCLSKFKDDNELLKFNLRNEEQRLAYSQKRFNELFNEKESQINTMRIPEIVIPDFKESRRIKYISLTLYVCPIVPLGSAKPSNLKTIQAFQSIFLRMVAKAPWYVTNAALHEVLKVPSINQTAAIFYQRLHFKMQGRTNQLISQLHTKYLLGNPTHPTPKPQLAQKPSQLIDILI